MSTHRAHDQAHQISVINSILNQLLGSAADARLLERLRPVLIETLEAAAASVAAELGIEVTVGISDPIAARYLEGLGPRLVGVNRFTRRRIRNVLVEEILKGAPLGRQISRLRKEFRVFRRGRAGRTGASRARTTARTETGIAWETGRQAQMIAAAVAASIWITARDLRVRDSHKIDGQCRAIGDPFVTNAGNLLLHPLDPSASAEEVINCRCTTAPSPRGCESPRLATYRARTRYWRQAIAQQRPHVRATVRALRVEWLRQERDLVAALREAA